jgi:hypothetical protein
MKTINSLQTDTVYMAMLNKTLITEGGWQGIGVGKMVFHKDRWQYVIMYVPTASIERYELDDFGHWESV